MLEILLKFNLVVLKCLVKQENGLLDMRHLTEAKLPERKIGMRRYLSIDIGRSIAIILMLFLHTVMTVLNISGITDTINDRPMLNVVALLVIPFWSGLAGFFLLVSSTSNMISMYRDLDNGKTIRSLVLKQIIGGIILLFFAMMAEGLTSYYGLAGVFFRNLNNISIINWRIPLYRWNHFETIHTIAWCLILNGCVQGLLSLNDNWKDRKRMIISYIILAVVVVGLTQPIWDLVGLVGPNFPYAKFPNGHRLTMPEIGVEPFWAILRAPFLAMLSSPEEPVFPYLAVSFIGSAIGIVLSQPREKISKNFPRKTMLIGTSMFVVGLIGMVIVLINIMNTTGNMDDALFLYENMYGHRHWSPDFRWFIPSFAWITQFLMLNGFSLMLFILLFRLIEYRGRSEAVAKRTTVLRRFGTLAFTIYNIQWIYYLVFALISFILKGVPYQRLEWGGTFLTLLITLSIIALLLWGWEKIKYVGSFEWFIRTVTNNAIAIRRERFDPSTKWWQRGQLDIENVFYKADWINIEEEKTTSELKSEALKSTLNDSKFSFILSLVGLCSILFAVASIPALIISIRAKKLEGENNRNKAAFIISIITLGLFIAFIIVALILKTELLGLF